MINEDKMKAMELAIEYHKCNSNVTGVSEIGRICETADSIYNWLITGSTNNGIATSIQNSLQGSSGGFEFLPVGNIFVRGIFVNSLNKEDNSGIKKRVLEWMPKFIDIASIYDYRTFYSIKEMLIDFSKGSKQNNISFRAFRDSLVVSCKKLGFDYEIVKVKGILHFKITPITKNQNSNQ